MEFLGGGGGGGAEGRATEEAVLNLRGSTLGSLKQFGTWLVKGSN